MFVDLATVMYGTFIFVFKTKRLDSSAASSPSNGSNTTFSCSILELNLDEDSEEDVAKEDSRVI